MELRILANLIGDDGLAALTRSPLMAALEWLVLIRTDALSLQKDSLGDDAVDVLARSALPSLRTLDLRGNALDHERTKRLLTVEDLRL